MHVLLCGELIEFGMCRPLVFFGTVDSSRGKKTYSLNLHLGACAIGARPYFLDYFDACIGDDDDVGTKRIMQCS